MYKDDYTFPDFFNSASFWTENIPSASSTIISLEAINKFNSSIKSKIHDLYSLDSEKIFLSHEALSQYIGAYKLPSKDMYDSEGQLVTNAFYEEIIHNTNLDGIKDINHTKYGMSVRKTSLRSFPNESSIFSSTQHSKLNNFDRFQETGCLACEPLLILHESRDKKWYFVKMYNYFGWAKIDDIALSPNRDEIFRYANCEDFLVVTGKEAVLTIDKKESSSLTIRCGMGTKLCLSESTESISEEYYKVRFPVRENSGVLSFKDAFIRKNGDMTKGYLNYTRHNIIDQALKFLDTCYDWGDKFNGKDCSSFIMTIYKCFGFLLPRNADEQELCFIDANNSIIFNKNDTLEDRYSKMDMLKPGAALFLQGHVMMYLGKYNGAYYMIHSFSGYGVKNGDSYEFRNALCVAISSIDLPTADGRPFIQKFTSAVHFQ